MPKHYASRTGQTAVRYEIVIRGTLGQPLVGPLEGMAVEVPGEESVLTGDVVDQAQLQGIISWLSDLGIDVVSINPLGGEDDQ
jgi:hypothetical protein